MRMENARQWCLIFRDEAINFCLNGEGSVTSPLNPNLSLRKCRPLLTQASEIDKPFIFLYNNLKIITNERTFSYVSKSVTDLSHGQTMGNEYSRCFMCQNGFIKGHRIFDLRIELLSIVRQRRFRRFRPLPRGRRLRESGRNFSCALSPRG